MKKLTSSEPITFKVNGSMTLTIDPDGVITTDDAAAVVAERLGDNVKVEDAGVDTFQDAEPAPAAVEETIAPPAPEPAPVEVVQESTPGVEDAPEAE